MVPGKLSPAADPGDEADGGFSIDVNFVALASGTCFAAKVVVRRLPSRDEVFSDRAINGGQGWATPQEALAVALARGYRYMREQACVVAAPPLPAVLWTKPAVREARQPRAAKGVMPSRGLNLDLGG